MPRKGEPLVPRPPRRPLRQRLAELLWPPVAATTATGVRIVQGRKRPAKAFPFPDLTVAFGPRATPGAQRVMDDLLATRSITINRVGFFVTAIDPTPEGVQVELMAEAADPLPSPGTQVTFRQPTREPGARQIITPETDEEDARRMAERLAANQDGRT